MLEPADTPVERSGAASDIPQGEVRVLVCGDGREVAVSSIDGEYFAIDNICTHDGGPLGEGRLQRGRVICPRHGAAFDARTGKVLTLPAVRSVKAYPVTVDGDDLFIDCSGSV